MSKNHDEGTKAVKNVKKAFDALAWLLLTAGIISFFYGMLDLGESIIAIGITLIGSSIAFFIARGLTAGFESMVAASEMYIKMHEKKEDSSIDAALKCMDKIAAKNANDKAL